MPYTIAVVGATGNVGREMLSLLAEREFPHARVMAVASQNSKGREVSFGEESVLKCEALEEVDFSQVDLVLSSPGASVSQEYAPKAAAAGAVVIDNTSYFRMHEGVPLVVPEVNAEALKGFREKNIIANPNCSTIQMVTALAPIHQAAGIKRVVVSTYQSVSGAGKEAMDELYDQTKALYMHGDQTAKQFTKRIAFNVIPHIDVFMEDGSTKEEWKMVVETKKILDPAIEVAATCVRVPVFIGHAETINIACEKPISAGKARDLLAAAPGVEVVDLREDGGYITPAECAGEPEVFVSRIREDNTIENGLNLWVVSDNLRKGAALNTVQIAETLVRDYGLQPSS